MATIALPVLGESPWATKINTAITAVNADLESVKTELPATIDGKIVARAAAETVGKILVIGSSIAFGIGASSTANAYPAKIAAHILGITGLAVQVVAAGVSGNNSKQMLARLPALLAEHRPTIVVLEGSINDSRTDVVLTVDESALAMQTMIMTTRLSGALPIITTSAPWDPFWWNNSGFTAAALLKSEQNNVRRREMAAAQGVLLVDIFKALKGGTGLLSDGLHPNDSGHSRWGATIAERILSQVPTLKYDIKVVDDFNRADAALISPWVNLSGTHSVVGNAAQGAGTYAAVVRPVGANVVLEGTYRFASTGVGLVARASDANNYIAADYATSDSTFRIYTRIGGTFATKATSVEAMADGDTLTLVVDGTHVMAWRNEHPVCGFTEPALVPTSINVGLWSSNSSRADSFSAFQ